MFFSSPGPYRSFWYQWYIYTNLSFILSQVLERDVNFLYYDATPVEYIFCRIYGESTIDVVWKKACFWLSGLTMRITSYQSHATAIVQCFGNIVKKWFPIYTYTVLKQNLSHFNSTHEWPNCVWRQQRIFDDTSFGLILEIN